LSSAVKEEVLLGWTKEERDNLPPKYGCQLIYEDASTSQIKDRSLPSDAYQVTYEIDGKVSVDICRGKRLDIFDLYYDKFGRGVLKTIDFGYGRVNPRLWGYKTPDKKGKR
jgi:hypothetical protein